MLFYLNFCHDLNKFIEIVVSLGIKLLLLQKYFLTDGGRALLANMTCNSHSIDLTEKINHLIEKLSEEEKRIALDLLSKER